MNIVILLACACILGFFAVIAGQTFAILQHAPIQECIDSGVVHSICVDRQNNT